MRVRTKTEIEQTLDQFRRTGECVFQIEMYKHCRKEYRILKKVDHFFDPKKQKMCDCRDVYLLEGSYCSGATAYLQRCDCNCFFFWHELWLEKL